MKEMAKFDPATSVLIDRHNLH